MVGEPRVIRAPKVAEVGVLVVEVRNPQVVLLQVVVEMERLDPLVSVEMERMDLQVVVLIQTAGAAAAAAAITAAAVVRIVVAV